MKSAKVFLTGVSWLGVEEPPDFHNHQIFEHFNSLSENFCAFAVGKDKGLNFVGKSLHLAPPTLQVSLCPWFLEVMNTVGKCFLKITILRLIEIVPIMHFCHA